MLIKKEAAGRKIEIQNQNSSQGRKYVIYRFAGSKEGSYQDPRNILDVVYNTKGKAVFVDKTARPGSVYTYSITSLSATGIESKDAYIIKE